MSLREYKIQSPKYMRLVGNGMVQEGEEEFLETEIPEIGLVRRIQLNKVERERY
jgi:hypothetical protein